MESADERFWNLYQKVEEFSLLHNLPHRESSIYWERCLKRHQEQVEFSINESWYLYETQAKDKTGLFNAGLMIQAMDVLHAVP